MNASTWSWRLACASSVVLGLCLVGSSRADEKGKKDSGKGKADQKVIVIQLDLSKAPPGLVKQLVELSKSKGKDNDDEKKHDGKKVDKKGNDDEKGEHKGKNGDDDDKREHKKSNIVQVDLNKLPPDLAKRLSAELAKSSDGGKKNGKKVEDNDEKRGKGKNGDDDDQKRGKGKNGDDDDDEKRSKKKGD